ncbi:alpha/beta hydrolase [Leisingera sp. ANG-M7]|uniref:alpha/beta hydrolase n=1 Tax=Leisingera sp. ANG-M7 TaxID=1577902 RepID=UPI00057E8268|nr:alpha/beta hydrolase [Leisingera sp. ANG-M7]KIC39709.1 hydrolase [Leisingera sp. ANG-M7]
MDGAPVDLQPAPLFAEIAQGPAGGEAHWVHTSDGLRIRAGHWRPEGKAKGTVLLFPGRTEYIEKYGPAAAEFAARGYATLTVDWRGQGLAGRMLAERRLGHVGHFTDFQKDVQALATLAKQLDLPRPWHLVGHSMGGAIGLRALIEGLDVNSCCFTGPMWGIQIPPLMRPLVRALGGIAPFLRLDERLLPTTALEQYVQITPFEGNTLTTDPEMYKLMHAQLAAQPDLALGGPTIQWLRVSLEECAKLEQMPSPALPCITFLGTDEQIVSPAAIRSRMDRWPGGELDLIKGGQHEVMMETPEIRAHVFSRMCRLFDQYSS